MMLQPLLLWDGNMLIILMSLKSHTNLNLQYCKIIYLRLLSVLLIIRLPLNLRSVRYCISLSFGTRLLSPKLGSVTPSFNLLSLLSYWECTYSLIWNGIDKSRMLSNRHNDVFTSFVFLKNTKLHKRIWLLVCTLDRKLNMPPQCGQHLLLPISRTRSNESKKHFALSFWDIIMSITFTAFKFYRFHSLQIDDNDCS